MQVDKNCVECDTKLNGEICTRCKTPYCDSCQEKHKERCPKVQKAQIINRIFLDWLKYQANSETWRESIRGMLKARPNDVVLINVLRKDDGSERRIQDFVKLGKLDILFVGKDVAQQILQKDLEHKPDCIFILDIPDFGYIVHDLSSAK